MSRDELKKKAARAAFEMVEEGRVLGVGTGSTTDFFIELLARFSGRIPGAVPSSERTAARLADAGIEPLPLDKHPRLYLYVDGADETDRRLRLVKGGGGALTREKIVASASDRFVCIVDDSKLVDRLGAFPLPVEVVPMAVSVVSRRLEELGGDPVPREGFVTDNGNLIIDVRGLSMDDPLALEELLDHVPGVVTNGIFARRPADVLLVGRDDGVLRLERDATDGDFPDGRQGSRSGSE